MKTCASTTYLNRRRSNFCQMYHDMIDARLICCFGSRKSRIFIMKIFTGTQNVMKIPRQKSFSIHKSGSSLQTSFCQVREFSKQEAIPSGSNAQSPNTQAIRCSKVDSSDISETHLIRMCIRQAKMGICNRTDSQNDFFQLKALILSCLTLHTTLGIKEIYRRT